MLMEKIDGGRLFREWVSKYERRVRKITESPKPGMLKANKTLYVALLAYSQRELNAWEELGERMPVAYNGAYAGLRLWMAAGFHTYCMDEFSDTLPREEVPMYFEFARSKGFPDDICDRVQLMAGVGISRHIPPPSVVIGDYTDCSPANQANIWVGRYWGVPTFFLDVPFEQDIEAIEYVEKQLRDIIAFCEREIPGIKYDEEKLVQYQRYHIDATAAMKKTLELSRHVPCPMAGRDALRMVPRLLYNDPSYPEYHREVAAEIAERVEKGGGPIKEEKYRLYWLVSAPFYADPFTFLEKQGCAIPLYEEGAGASSEVHQIGDEKRFGRKLNPIQEEATIILTGHWAGPGERRVQEVLQRCAELNIEGLVHFKQPGCVTCNAMAYWLGDKVEKELGIPSLYIQGWCQDLEKHDEAEFEARLGEWLSLCLERKQFER
jgi:hypothetical protein